MPNWVKNIVTIEDTEALKKMLTKDEEGKLQFDFNVVLPMPEELSTTQYPTEDTNKKLKELKEKYGASNWYDWRCDNWGTKWNASDAVLIDDNTIEINTAWSTPEPVIKAISEKFKTRVFVKYADEDIGYNCGEYEYSNGELKYEYDAERDEEGDSVGFADNVWGWA